VAVLLGTHDGYRTFRSSGAEDTALAGRSVDAFTPGPADTWVAIVDGSEVWSYGADEQWSVLARSEHVLVSLAAAGDVVFAGTGEARMVRCVGGGVEPLDAFDAAPGRDEWHQVGAPIEVRSLTASCDGAVVYANVHVGGVLRSSDGGQSWAPTMPVDNDVHQVVAHPDRPEVVAAAAAIGLLRSHDAGRTWALETGGLPSTYSRGLALDGDDLWLSAASGPMARHASLFHGDADAGGLAAAGDGLPEQLDGMIDTRFVAARDGRVAVATRAGEVWARPDASSGWEHLATGIAGATCVAVTGTGRW